MRNRKLWIATMLVLALGPAATLSAATYTNASVTATTLNEADAENILNDSYAYSGTSMVLGGGTDADYNSAHDASLLVDNASVTLSSHIFVAAHNTAGYWGSDNVSLTIQNGGTLTSAATQSYTYNSVGGADADGASVFVTGDGSMYSAKRIVRFFGTNGTITAENGGLFASTGDTAGMYGSGTNGNICRLNGGCFALSAHIFTQNSNNWDDALEVMTLSDGWVVLSAMTEAQKAAVNFQMAQCETQAEFETLTGLDGSDLDFSDSYSFNGETVSGVTVFISNIPEPTTMALLALGGVMGLRRRRRR